MQAIFNGSHIKFSFVVGLFFSSNYSVRLQPVPAGLPAFICTKVTYRVWEKTCHVGNSSSWTGLQKIVSCFIVQHYSVIDIYTILAIGTKLSSKLSAKKKGPHPQTAPCLHHVLYYSYTCASAWTLCKRSKNLSCTSKRHFFVRKIFA